MSAGGRLKGVGVDLAGVDRLAAAMSRRAGLARRLFTEAELEMVADAAPLSVAQRFAAKEAVMKALGVGIDSVAFTTIETARDLRSASLTGAAAERAAELGVRSIAIEVDRVDGPTGEVAVARAEAAG